jgi:membrane protease YdiL (CAAX protease family)
MSSRDNVRRLEAVAVISMAALDLVVHLSLITQPWLVILAMSALIGTGLWRRLDRLVGAGVIFVASAICAQYYGTSPVPLVVGALAYLTFDRLRPSPARARWITAGRGGRDAVVLIIAVVVTASSALLVWSHVAHPHLRARALFPANTVLVVLVAIAFATLNAFGEELCYRAALQTSLEDTLASPVTALVVQGAFFGAAHLHGAERMGRRRARDDLRRHARYRAAPARWLARRMDRACVRRSHDRRHHPDVVITDLETR